MNQEVMWSKRYRDAGEHYLFGTEPNRFLAHRAERLQDGKTALSVADGEGRNSVWLAEQGLDVTAVEISSIAVEKARRLAAGRDAAVDFVLADMLAADWPPADLHEGFDWVVGIFIQFVGPAGPAAAIRGDDAAHAPGRTHPVARLHAEAARLPDRRPFGSGKPVHPRVA
jgi:hypothetical protein